MQNDEPKGNKLDYTLDKYLWLFTSKNLHELCMLSSTGPKLVCLFAI